MNKINLATLGLAGILCLALSGCKTSNQLTVVGLDSNGQAFEQGLDSDKFTEAAEKLIEQGQDASLLALENHDQSNSHWKLKRFTLGLNFTTDAGLRFIYEVGGSSGVKFNFEPGSTEGSN